MYGSFAVGAERPASDIDLFVVGSTEETELINLAERMEKKFDREVHYVLMTEAEFKKTKRKKLVFNEYF